MKLLVWGYGEMHNSEKNKAKPYGKTRIQRNGDTEGRWKGGFGGSRYDFSHAWLYMQEVMHDFSYA